jgi:uncharacterized protein YjbI with pentapeptide repeats
MASSSISETAADSAFTCGCAEWMRSACTRELFYKEHDGKPYCVLHYPGIEKAEEFKRALERKLHDRDYDFRGVWFPTEVSFASVTFSANAYFSSAQFSANADFSDARFNAITDFGDARFNADANFHNTQFNETVYFLKTHFSEDAFFFGAQFIADAYVGARYNAAAVFGYALFFAAAYFGGARITETAYFRGAQFYGTVIFSNVVFNATVNFLETKFLTIDSTRGSSRSSENEATIAEDAVKEDAKTVQVSFAGAVFKDVVSFKENTFAESVFMSFDAAIFEKPERATFHSIPLRPHWFINVDSRKFTFINVSWGFLDKRNAISREIEGLERSERIHLTHLLEITFRQLAVNAEENNRYEEAANFRYMAMEVKRLQRWRKADLFRLSWWYWLLSGYGERVTRAFGALITIWLLFALIYWWGNTTWWQPKQSGKIVAAESSELEKQPISAIAPLTVPEALIYSAGVMTLQKPEPLPANKRAKAFVLFETILGPLQAALLALAIRRKFMR